MQIKGADFFTQLRIASITAELKLQAKLCQSDQTVFHNSPAQRTKQICTSGPAAIRPMKTLWNNGFHTTAVTRDAPF
jgi:hypothetical protein